MNSANGSSVITPTTGTVLTGDTTIGVSQSSGSLTLASTISGSFGITKVGSGTLTLQGSGSNSFTGATNVNDGTLVLDNPALDAAVGGTVNIGDGIGAPGSAALVEANNYQLSSGVINVAIQSDGVLNIQSHLENVDTLTMTGGSVTGVGGELFLFGSVTTQANSVTATISVSALYSGGVESTFTIAQGTTANGIDLDVSSVLAGSNLIKAGPGAMRLSGDNTFTGGVVLNAGTLIIGNDSALGTGTLTAGGGALAADNNGPYTVSNAVSLSNTLNVSGGGNFTLAGPISGSAGITKTGSGVLTLSGIESFTGPININGGTLAMNTSLSSNVTNSATFVYNNGTFGGRLTNLGTVVLNADFTAGNGMENDGNFTLAIGQTVTLNGAGLDNEGTFAMTGGTLNLIPAGSNVNRGDFNLSANLGLGGATLTNSGSFVMAGGLVSGASGTLTNTFGGVVSGTGTIQNGFSNGGGTLIVGVGPMNIMPAFSNTGLIQLTAANSNLVGGAITNGFTGSIQGLGVVENAVVNDGTIEALGGTLSLSGSLTNLASGTLTAGSGSQLFVTAGLTTNHGIINLTGGIFDNGGNPLNNASNGQISGWGIFRTGGTGLDNHGSITFTGGLTTVNGPVTNENGQTIVVAYNPAIFTGPVTNNGTGTFNIVSTTAVFAGGSSGAFSGTFTNNANSAFGVGGSGVLEVDGAPSLGAASSMAVGGTSTLRFKPTTGASSVGTGVTATVASGATLELAGSVSSLSSGANRVNITNNSSSAGILVSGTDQQVGNIDGSGTTQVDAGSDLTANHIVQGALVIGGTAGSPARVTIDASDASGNPLGHSNRFVVVSSLAPTGPFEAGETSSANFGSGDGTDQVALLAGNLAVGGNSSAVPEPSTLLLVLLAVLAVFKTHFARKHIRWQTV